MRARYTLLLFAVVLLLIPAITSTQTGGGVVFLGTEVLPLGNAVLEVDTIVTVIPTSRFDGAAARPTALEYAIIMYAIGSSGNDGASFQLGSAEGAVIGFPHLASDLPFGGWVQFDANLVSGIVPCVRIAKDAAGGGTITPDFSAFGASTYRAEVWDDGVQVAAFDGLTGDVVTSMFPIGFEVDTQAFRSPFPLWSLPAGGPTTADYKGVVVTPDGAQFQFGISQATGDELRMYPQGPIVFSPVGSIDMTAGVPAAAEPETLRVSDAAHHFFGRNHRGTGKAKLVSNIGPPPVWAGAGSSARADHREIGLITVPGELVGIRTELDRDEVEACLIWEVQGPASNGDTDRPIIVGRLYNGEDAELGRVDLVHDGSAWTVTPFFASAPGGTRASTAETVHLYLVSNGNEVVGEVPAFTSSFSVVTDQWANETGVANDGVSLILAFPTPVPMDVPSLGTLTAQKVIMRSNGVRRHRHFSIIDRSVMSSTAIPFFVTGTPSVMRPGHSNSPAETPTMEIRTRGATYMKRGCSDCLIISNIGASGDDGVEFIPLVHTDNFGVEWAPFGPASTDEYGRMKVQFAFETDDGTGPVAPADPGEPGLHAFSLVQVMVSVGFVPNGSMVDLFLDPEMSNTTSWHVTLRNAGVIVDEYHHTSSVLPAASMDDSPIAAGYQVLSPNGHDLSLWFDFGYPVNVTTPGPTMAASSSAMKLADSIEIRMDTGVDIPPQATRSLNKLYVGPLTVIYHIEDDPPGPPSPVRPTPTPETVLNPAYPNPFNPRTTLSFNLSRTGNVTMKIYTVEGRYVATIHDGPLTAGPREFTWQGTNANGHPVASGVYLVELRAPDGVLRQKVSLLK